MIPCAECAKPFTPIRDGHVFCAAPCRVSFHNILKRRGQVLTLLAQVWRRAKHGEGRANAQYAFAEMCSYLDAANAADAKAGRDMGLVVAEKRASSHRWADGAEA